DLTPPARTETEITFDPTGTTPGQNGVAHAETDTLVFEVDHNFTTGQRVTYSSGGGTPIGGLADGDYYAIKVERNVLKLARTAADAQAGPAIHFTTGPPR